MGLRRGGRLDRGPARPRRGGDRGAHGRHDPAVDPEGHLLDLATGLDISGRNIERWPRPFLAELVDRFPRLDLAERFGACFAEQAARKPGSAAAAAVRSGLADRLARNPLDALDGAGGPRR